MTRSLPFLLASLLAAFALAGEAKKPKPPESPNPERPTEDDLDKPGKAAVPSPRPIPVEAADEKDDQKQGDEQKPEPPEKVNPFRQRSSKPSYALPARITWSDGTVREGFVWRRANAPSRIFHREKRAHEDYFLSDLKRIDVAPEQSNFERDWRWKNQGSSEKVFLEIGYFWDLYLTTFTLSDGTKVAGDCSGQFYLLTLDDKPLTWTLYKRLSGRDTEHKKREELKPLLYVKSVDFTDDFLKKPEEKSNP